ncbi:hypothetical protein GA0070609_3391 [Micromonospora echinaurantiaca]|uniref:Uncharacterized protein n=1 Tax=Micromonospora echinaurantiaca TaxID=47857 RepID=A0A1C5IHU7_9ACTN|nr:hypothetical protein [Micromonospora echinaurantiaca]SCG57988.1 hypothetical protein GA0070609_3391 [Micromonospora echinaurantiaca]
MESAATPTWIMTVEYAGVSPAWREDDGTTDDSRVNPIAISRIGDRLTILSAVVAAVTEQEAHEIGLVGLGRWAQRIGVSTHNPTVVALFAKDIG